ncbi:hypothetical protein E6C60_2050 [Paenibacillus algicola]|uniref:Thioredoxin domain-containing protein n=1 Tax=Paenibacillus algicola TaxID=2565926 RepID=A0A4P8XK61_9BACL|nr:thioredoxin family protein [Paenibacillus algicola]QCT02765.1 hypothetical protein E6C60_2050 [Paenibacillus algicola]
MIAISEREFKERLAWQQQLRKQGRNGVQPVIVFLHTPFCGTCKAARKMLEVAEAMLPDGMLLESDVNFLPDLVQQLQVRSVPALLAVTDHDAEPYKILYRMGSVQDILSFVRGVMR